MSLKTFHLIFITAAVILSVFTGIWAVQFFFNNKAPGYLFITVLSFTFAIALGIYEYFFLKKPNVP